MRMYRVTVTMNPDKHPDGDFGFDVERTDEPSAWGDMVEYLGRLQHARIIDDWEAGEYVPDGPGDVLAHLQREFNEDLEDIESGYELPYSDGGGDSDPTYRREMKEAGRGALLR